MSLSNDVLGTYYPAEDDLALADRLARLPEATRNAVLEGIGSEAAHEALAYDFSFWGRPSQLDALNATTPFIAMLAGRGYGKTRSLAQWVHKKAMELPGSRGILIGRVTSDVRDVIILGESGIMSVAPPSERPRYVATMRRIVWPNGSEAMTFCASSDTEALTRNGWVHHNELAIGDEVYAIDPDTGKGVWSPVTKVNVFSVVDEPMLESSGHVSSLTTMSHRWLVRGANGRGRGSHTVSKALPETDAGFHWRESHEWLRTQKAYWYVPKTAPFDVPTDPKYTDDLVALVAWTMTEGSTAWVGNPRTSVRPSARKLREAICISQSQEVNSEHFLTIKHLLTRMYGPPSQAKTLSESGASRGGSPSWRVSGDKFFLNHEASMPILEHFDSHKRVRMSFVHQLTRAQLELFVQTCVYGDGSSIAHHAHPWALSQSGDNIEDARRVDALGMACVLLGKSVRWSDGSFVYKDSVKLSAIIGHQLKQERRLQNRRIVKYTGEVWCPTTEVGTWLARRDGTVYFTGNSADLPDQLRGPQGHWAACDELGSWRQKPAAGTMGLANAWDQVKIATRLGHNPQIFVATTPRRVPTIRDILKIAQETPDKMTLIRGSTNANRHLSPEYLDTVIGMYAGTSLAAQELDGLLLGDTDGALLSMDVIDEYRDLVPPPIDSLPLRVVGLDPSVAENPNDECGIVLAGSTGEREPFRRHAYIYEDWSLKGGPNQWAKAATALAKQHNAVIVAEQNQGVELVRMVLTAADPTVPVILVKAQQGKQLRAEPVILAYEQGRVHHTEYFSQLEDQYTTWVPAESKYSPDRVDAAVHALTALLVKAPVGFDGGVRTSRRQSRSLVVPSRSGPAIPVPASIVTASDHVKEQELAMGAGGKPYTFRGDGTGRGNAASIASTSPSPRRRWIRRRRTRNEDAES